MTTLDGPLAATAAEHVTTNTPGYCFSRVSDYFGRPDSTGPGAGHYGGYAIALWTYSGKRHPGDRNPPRGAVLLYGVLSRPRWAGDTDYMAGDTTIGIGGDRQRATDYPTNGRVGTCTIAEREAQTGRPYLGWIGDFMGNPISFATTASESAVALQKGTIVMKNYHYQDRRAKSLAPGKYVFQRQADNKQDQNVVGGIGPYSITPHLYAEGMDEGDSLQLQLVWENTRNKPASSVQSGHYTETVRANRDGVINHSVEFKRAVVAGDMVFVKVTAPTSNKKSARITVIDCDGYLFG